MFNINQTRIELKEWTHGQKMMFCLKIVIADVKHCKFLVLVNRYSHDPHTHLDYISATGSRDIIQWEVVLLWECKGLAGNVLVFCVEEEYNSVVTLPTVYQDVSVSC